MVDDPDLSIYARLMLEVDLLRSMASRLDKNSVVLHTSPAVPRAGDVYKEVLSSSKTFPRLFEDHARKLFGFYEKLPKIVKNPYSPESMYMDYLAENSKLGRKSELISRLLLECRARPDWFYVFNTLTVRPGSEQEVFGPASKSWQNYIVRCDRLFGQAAHGSIRKAFKARRSGQEFHTYIAVVERGSLHGRLHIHVLHIFKTIPKYFYDPNRGLRLPRKREIDVMKSLWDFGNSSPIAVRFHADDAYARKGWRWPIDTKKASLLEQKPLKVSCPEQVVYYVAKYINKNYLFDQSYIIGHYSDVSTSPKGGSQKCPIRIKIQKMWRTRVSRNLARQPLAQIVRKISKMQVRQVLLRGQFPKVLRAKVPRMILRRMILKNYLRTTSRLAGTSMMRFQRALSSPRRPIERLIALTRGLRLFNPLKCGNSKIRDSLGLDAFNKLKGIIHETFTATTVTLSGISGPYFRV